MKDEIKEILECLEKYGQLTPDAIDDLHYIRDYITCLEQENSEQLDENLKQAEWLVKKQKRIEKAREFLDDEYNYKKGDAKFNRTDYVIWQSLTNILNGSDE